MYQIDPRRRDIILEDLRLITVESNEAERSVAVIGDLVKAIVDALLKAGKNANFKAQNIYFDDGKKDFITDFELYENERLFHIVEAKGSTGLAGAKDQLEKQLLKSHCKHGCITDGYHWQFVMIEENKAKFDGMPFSLAFQIDEIAAKIFSYLS